MKTHSLFPHRRAVGAWVISAIVLAAGLGLAPPVRGEEAKQPPPVGPMLQSISVNVLAENAGNSPYGGRGVQGSGTVVVAIVADKPTTWVLTAHHVVKNLRVVTDVVSPDGTPKKQIRYGDAKIIQERTERSRTVGEVKYDARVVSVDPSRDIALLRVRKDRIDDIPKGAVFYLGVETPLVGIRVFHCGAPGGKDIGGTSTLTSGIISRVGVTIPEFGGAEHGLFDQTDCAGLGGSSGGLIALESDGRWIGMITLGLGGGSDSFHWMVPIRSVREWAKQTKLEWLLDPALPRPSEADIEAIPLELTPAGYPGPATKADAPKAPTDASLLRYRLPNDRPKLLRPLLDHNDPVEYDVPLED